MIARLLFASLFLLFSAFARADITKEATWSPGNGGNGHTYRVVAKSGLISWDQANAEAQAAGGYLVTITSATENAFVFSLIDDPAFWRQSANDHGPWIGAYQPAGAPEPDGGWTWVVRTGQSVPEQFAYSNWESGEPNNLTTTVSGTSYSQNNAAFFHVGTGRAPTWSDEYNQTGGTLNQWTFSYVIEFSETPFLLTNLARLSDGTFQFTITNRPSSYFQVYATTNLLLPFNQWTLLGSILENPAGVFRFVDFQATNMAARFYRVISP